MNRQPCRSAEVPGLLPECFRTFRSVHGLRLVLLTGFPDYRASRATATRVALKMPPVLWVGNDQLVAGICIAAEQHYLVRSFTTGYPVPSLVCLSGTRVLLTCVTAFAPESTWTVPDCTQPYRYDWEARTGPSSKLIE